MKVILIQILIYSFSIAFSSAQVIGEQDTSSIFQTIEVHPKFPGHLGKYISANTIYPKSAIQNNEQGRAIVAFDVEKDGSINNARVIISSGYEALDTEAIRVVSNMPNWIPGMMDNKPVKMQFSLPVSFKLM